MISRPKNLANMYVRPVLLISSVTSNATAVSHALKVVIYENDE